MEKSKLEDGEYISDMAIPYEDLRGYIRKYHEAGMDADRILDLIHKHLRISDTGRAPKTSSESDLKNISIPDFDVAGWTNVFMEAGFSREETEKLIARINADPELKDRLRRRVINIPIEDKSTGPVSIPVTIGKKEGKPVGEK
ncbi:MAG: hypothetical protein Q8P07_05705 [bacterium]|nr:hypothetical protein [bacterium]